MSDNVESNNKEVVRSLVITKAEEYLYNNTQTSSAKQVDDIVKGISKLYDI